MYVATGFLVDDEGSHLVLRTHVQATQTDEALRAAGILSCMNAVDLRATEVGPQEMTMKVVVIELAESPVQKLTGDDLPVVP